MQNLKLFVVILTMLVTSSFISSADGCFEDDGCGPWQQGGTDIVILPDFPQCSIQVQWHYRICGNKKQIDFTAMGLIGNCDNLLSYLFPFGTNGYPDKDHLARVYADVFDHFVHEYFQSDYNWALIDPNEDENEYMCPNTKVYENSFPAKCGAWCYATNFEPPPGMPPFIFAVNNCEDVACCLQRYTICKDESGEIQSTREFVVDTGTCSSGDPETLKCNGWEQFGYTVYNLPCGSSDECVDPME